MHGLVLVDPHAIEAATPKRVHRRLPTWMERAADAIETCMHSVMPGRLREAAKQAGEEGLVTADEAALAFVAAVDGLSIDLLSYGAARSTNAERLVELSLGCTTRVKRSYRLFTQSEQKLNRQATQTRTASNLLPSPRPQAGLIP